MRCSVSANWSARGTEEKWGMSEVPGKEGEKGKGVVSEEEQYSVKSVASTVQCRECEDDNIRRLEREKNVRLFPPSVESSWVVSTLVDCHLNRREMLNGTLPCRMEETRGWMK